MRRYLVHGVCLESNCGLPQFASLPDGKPELTIFRTNPSPHAMGQLPQAALALKSFYVSPRGGRGSFELYRLEDFHVLRLSSLCDFQVYMDGSEITIHPRVDVRWEDIRPFLIGRVLPLALSYRGLATLHAGCVGLPGGAIAFLGRPGTGKSTLVASFTSSGFPLVADDVLAATEEQGRFCVFFGSAQVRLRDDSLAVLGPSLASFGGPTPDYDKSRLQLRHRNGHKRDSPVPLRAIYLLHRETRAQLGGVEITALSPKEALPVLVGRSTNIRLLERKQIARRQFAFLSRLVTCVPVKRLRYPSNLKLLDSVLNSLLEDQGVRSVSRVGELG